MQGLGFRVYPKPSTLQPEHPIRGRRRVEAEVLGLGIGDHWCKDRSTET